MPQGTVKEYDADTGTGVLLEDDRTEVYLDMASTDGSEIRYLRIGQRVKYDRVEEHGRHMARNLHHITFD